MRNKVCRNLGFVFLIFFIVIISSVRANSFIQEYNKYVEVCDNGIAYVPLDTKYVTCHGIILEIKGMTRSLAEDEFGCECPICCDGWCYIIVYSDPAPENETDKSADRMSDQSFYGKENSLDIIYLWFTCKNK